MHENKIAVIIPAYLEEELIEQTIRGVPELVHQIIVVDDASPDETAERARAVNDARVEVMRHRQNQGVGAAIYSGYRRALQDGADILVVMAGDNQMQGSDLPALIAPIADGTAEYVKGNRLQHPLSKDMPFLRRLGTQFLAGVTSLFAGFSIGDSQCGYTALSRNAAAQLPWSDLWKRYGYPNDLLLVLTHLKMRVVELPVRPVYANEKSGLRPWHILSILRVILRRKVKQWWPKASPTGAAPLLMEAAQSPKPDPALGMNDAPP